MNYRINKKIFYRFEPNLEDEGILIIFNIETDDLFELSKPYYEFLQCIEKGYNEFKQKNYFREYYPEISKEELDLSLTEIRKTLLEMGVIYG